MKFALGAGLYEKTTRAKYRPDRTATSAFAIGYLRVFIQVVPDQYTQGGEGETSSGSRRSARSANRKGADG